MHPHTNTAVAAGQPYSVIGASGNGGVNAKCPVVCRKGTRPGGQSEFIVRQARAWTSKTFPARDFALFKLELLNPLSVEDESGRL